jgi:outer membrane lipoprotein-sorting protein
MKDEVERLVREIRTRTANVSSFSANHHSISRMQLMPIEAKGKVLYLAPDKFRAEVMVNGQEIVMIRRGTAIRRYIPKRRETWKYDLQDIPETLPINAGVADLKDPFLAVDEDGLRYEGRMELDGSAVHAFTGDPKNRASAGLLDTRKGFSIRYQPKCLDIRLRLYVDLETGLLRRTIGVDAAGRELLRVDYQVEAVNVPLDEGLFTIDEANASYRQIDITDTLIASLNPDAAEAPASPN